LICLTEESPAREESPVLRSYSIVIPAYNEAARIRRTIEHILAFVSDQQWNAEILVVNDGSTDNTAQVVQDYAAQNRALRLIENPGNRGKGYSVRNGVLHSNGEIVLFSDADLSSPIEESLKLFTAIEAGADVAIGSRWLRTELQVQRQPLYRQFYGRLFNLVLRLVLGLHFRDTQCGFKAFTRKAAYTIFPLQHIERWGFDPEILFLARRFGFRTEEVAVRWAHREGTRINPLRDGMRMAVEVLRIRWYSLTGRYDAKEASVAATL
jgi:dolichyl-phosphate beta-glucosyltransferase